MDNSMWRSRREGWSNLEEASSRGVERGVETSPAISSLNRVRELLAMLEPREYSGGFPGRRRCQRAQRPLAGGDLGRFTRLVSDINRCLARETFRRGAAVVSRDKDTGSDPTEPRISAETRPHVEVLVVDEMTAAREQSPREEPRRPEDGFVSELVVVSSSTDAVTAALLTFNVRAWVIRRRLPHRSPHDLAALGVVMDERVAEKFADQSPGQRAQALGQRLRHIHPELDLSPMTKAEAGEITGQLSHDLRRVSHTREGPPQSRPSMPRGVAHHYRAPFFTAPRDYSHTPTRVFHTPPISRGKSVVDSHRIQEMVSFHGINIFPAETSATRSGLDSLQPANNTMRHQRRRRRVAGSYLPVIGNAGPPAAML